MVSKLACGDVPEEVIDGIRLGRLTALNKPDGGVRGIVVGDIIRRLVARTMAKQVAKKAEKATAPFQYALSTKAGCECIAHILQALTDRDANAIVVTVDGVGAYDLISRNAMMEGILKMEDGDQILPFVRCFYGSPSTYLWEDEMGVAQEIPQGEEQGDPLMPMLFSLGQHAALEAIKRRSRDHEKLFAFLHDLTVVCHPDKVRDVMNIISQELQAHAHISIHHEGVEELTRRARLVKPDAVVWKGDHTLLRQQQGIRVLGAPLGSAEYVQSQLEQKSVEQETLFHRIPQAQDTQASWLLLMCGATRSNFWLRMVRPDQVQNFAERRDLNVWRCLQALLGIEGAPELARMLSNLPLSRGGLGLSCAVRSSMAAHWSSWADCVHMIKQRHPEVAEIMLTGIDHEVAPCFQAVRDCADTLREAGLVMPTWRSSPTHHQPGICRRSQ